jgi:xanthosine utilization system XapX-like protein
VALGAKSANQAAGHTGSGQGLLAAVLGIIGLFAGYILVTSARELASMRAAANNARDHNDELKRASQEDYRQQQQNAAQARMNAEHAREAANEAEHDAQKARSALERPLALVDAAVAAAAPLPRIVPFTLPGQLALES